jgi:phosphatidylserine synthase
VRGGRWPANLATLANGLVGVGAIVYVLAGNPLWAMLLIVSGIGFDGLDGWLSRRSGLPGNAFGRAADSVSDAVTFGLAPASLVVVHTMDASAWGPYAVASVAVGAVFAALAIARLVYFTYRGYRRSDFLGAPTPQAALSLVVLLLFVDAPAFLGPAPLVALVGAAAISATMILPVPFPKIKRSSTLRPAMIGTAVAVVVAVLVLQFRPATGSVFYGIAAAAGVVAAVGVVLYYFVGPFTVASPTEPAAPGRNG